MRNIWDLKKKILYTEPYECIIKCYVPLHLSGLRKCLEPGTKRLSIIKNKINQILLHKKILTLQNPFLYLICVDCLDQTGND